MADYSIKVDTFPVPSEMSNALRKQFSSGTQAQSMAILARSLKKLQGSVDAFLTEGDLSAKAGLDLGFLLTTLGCGLLRSVAYSDGKEVADCFNAVESILPILAQLREATASQLSESVEVFNSLRPLETEFEGCSLSVVSETEVKFGRMTTVASSFSLREAFDGVRVLRRKDGDWIIKPSTNDWTQSPKRVELVKAVAKSLHIAGYSEFAVWLWLLDIQIQPKLEESGFKLIPGLGFSDNTAGNVCVVTPDRSELWLSWDSSTTSRSVVDRDVFVEGSEEHVDNLLTLLSDHLRSPTRNIINLISRKEESR